LTDKGPWKVEVWEQVVCVTSADEAHSAYLRVGGDFTDTAGRKKYAQEVADVLNAALTLTREGDV
jgi:hypothetical protein